MKSSDSTVILTHGLSSAYAGVAVFNRLDLQVPKHSILGFLGSTRSTSSTGEEL